MNILHIISGGEVGGSKKHLLTLVQNIKFHEIRSIIVCFLEGELYDEAINLGLDIRLIKQTKRFDLTVTKKLKAICIEEDIDIINCHGGRANFVGAFLKLRYDAKYVSTIHSDYKDDYMGNKFKTKVFSNINAIALKRFNNFITVSDNFKEMLINRGFKRDKIHVVYNGIEFNKKIGVFDREAIISENGLMGVKNYVSMVGRFHPVKGHKVFLDACKLVLEKYTDVMFIIVGDGAIREELKEYTEKIAISNSVYFAGFKVPDDYFYLSNFTILASYNESFPLTVLESAFYEKTVVATRVGGVDKLIDDGENGFIVDVGDSVALSEKILQLLLDPDKATEFGIKLYEKARDNYSIENMVTSYIKIYKEIDGGIYI